MMATQEENLFEFAAFDEKESEHIAAPRYSYWKSVWRTFVRSKVTIPLTIFVIILVVFALVQPMYSGYSPMVAPNINNSEMKNILNRSDKSSKAVADFPIPYETDLESLEAKLPEILKGKYQYFTQADTSRLRAAGYTEEFLDLEEAVADYVRKEPPQGWVAG